MAYISEDCLGIEILQDVSNRLNNYYIQSWHLDNMFHIYNNKKTTSVAAEISYNGDKCTLTFYYGFNRVPVSKWWIFHSSKTNWVFCALQIIVYMKDQNHEERSFRLSQVIENDNQLDIILQEMEALQSELDYTNIILSYYKENAKIKRLIEKYNLIEKYDGSILNICYQAKIGNCFFSKIFAKLFLNHSYYTIVKSAKDLKKKMKKEENSENKKR